MAKETVYNNTLVSGAADETLTYTRYVKDESSGKSTKELLDEKVNKTDQLGTTQIADKAVTTEKLENESVTTDKLDAASVTTEKVADANITTSKLADSSVETEKINNKAVTTDKLNDGAVDNSKLSPNAVTSEKIKDESIITEKLNDRAVTTEKVEEKAITNAKLGDQSVDGRVVREASLESKHFSNESVTTEKVARKSITKDKLADNAVDASQVVDGSIDNAKLSPDSVTTEKIKDGSVTNEKIADNTLGIGKFDPELRKTIQAATGLPEDLNQMIQDIDQSVKQLHEKDTDLQSQIDDKQQQITANDEDISLLQARSTQMEETIKSIAATGGASQATAVTYNNEKSKLTAVNIQSAVDEVVDKTAIKDEEGNVQDTPFRVVENEEFIMEVVDSEDKVLFGIYRATGKPYYPQNDMYHVEQNEEFFAVWLDAANHVLLGIRRDGEIIGEIHAVNALKQVVSQLQSDLASLQEKVGTIDTNLKELLDVFSLQENPEYLAVEQDAEGKVLSATNPDGSHYIHNAKSETIPTEFSHIEDPEGRTEITTDAENKILGYRDSEGVHHESGMEVEQFYQNGKKVEYATKNYVDTKPIDDSEIALSRLDGVVDYSLENLFDKNKIRTYDSDFATKVFNAIGRKTGVTGCYSNNIPCKEGDWFTRNDFGTGIVVVLDKNDNILGDVKNVAYKPTFQIKASENQDFSKAVSVVMVVMLNALDTERIVNAKYVPAKEEDAIRIPKLKVGQENIELGITTYVKGSSGRYYSLNVEDLEGSPQISLVKLEGIPSSELPSDFPKFTISGSFSDYYKSLVLCPIEGGTEYLLELGTNGLVSRYLKKKVNCPRLIKENGVQYYYGVDGYLNISNGELNIYKAKDETFELVKGNIRDSEGNNIEPHDCLVLSVNPLHVISQRYVSNQKTIVDGVEKTVTSLHVEEQYNGKRVWLWKSEDYPELWKDSHYKGNDADYLHNNTICIDKDNNLVLNNKHANQILVISRTWSDDTHIGTIGDILWKIGGNQGSNYNYDVATRIKTTTQQQWFECHDAVVDSEGLYTLFDNRESGASRIVEFNIDTENKAVKNFNSFTYQSYRGRYMGSVDKLADGIFLVSWGSFRSAGTPNIGIYDFKNGKTIFEMKMDSDSYSVYRVYGIRK